MTGTTKSIGLELTDAVAELNAVKAELSAYKVMIADERAWWAEIRPDHGEHIMPLRDAAIKRLNRASSTAISENKAKALLEFRDKLISGKDPLDFNSGQGMLDNIVHLLDRDANSL